jgi:alpha-L-fucosidase
MHARFRWFSTVGLAVGGACRAPLLEVAGIGLALLMLGPAGCSSGASSVAAGSGGFAGNSGPSGGGGGLGGTSSSGGSANAAGTGGSGVAGGTGGVAAGAGGSSAAGGQLATGGGAATSGGSSAGGSSAPGGQMATGGGAATGGAGAAGSGGKVGSGGVASAGGVIVVGAGGKAGTGGVTGSGGLPGVTGGAPAAGGMQGTAGASGTSGSIQDPEDLKKVFAEYRFGMFIHFGMNTFSNDGAKDLPNQDPSLFNPTKLNPGQWIDAAVSAKMKFAVLTTKHHDGFLLWDSATTDYDTGNAKVPTAGHVDVVKLYVDACRARGVAPGLYFSIQDRSTPGLGSSGWTVTNERMPRAIIDYVKAQIKELLTNYGYIPLFVTDGWAWSMGMTIMPYQEIREYMYQISPNTLYVEHQGQQIPWHDDIVYYEEPKGGAWSPAGNILASWQSQKMGHAWFWTPPDAGDAGPAVSDYVTKHLADLEPKYTNYAPDFGPNREGLLEPAMVASLKAVGAAWSPNMSRPPLPTQPPHLNHVITAVNATASSTASGSKALNAVDGINDGGFTDHYTETVWQSAAAAPQSLTIDLGATYSGIDMLSYQPPQIAPQQASQDFTGRITGYSISYSTDGTTFLPATLKTGYDGTWSWGATQLAGWASTEFNAVTARYVKLQANSAAGNNVKINEVDVGGRLVAPIAN